MPFGKVCCNPFRKLKHKTNKIKCVRKVSQSLRERFPQYLHGQYICASCRMALLDQAKSLIKKKKNENNFEDFEIDTVAGTSTSALKVANADESLSESDIGSLSEETTEEAFNEKKNTAFFYLNKCLEALNESPIEFKNNYSKYKQEEILGNINSIFRKNLFSLENISCDGEDILNHLKENYNTSEDDKDRQIKILTSLPHSWSVGKIEKTFSTTNYMARKAKKLIQNGDYYFSSHPKRRSGLSTETKSIVEDFYRNDKNSRVMPGKKDYKSVKSCNGEKEKKQKRLMLCNLKELHNSFQEVYPTVKIGFSKFSELRPQECILIGGSGTHTVCVCAIHQNSKLMFIGGKIKELAEEEVIGFPTYKHWIAQSICNPATVQCYMGNCSLCPGDTYLKDALTNAYSTNNTENITYKQWVQVDRSNLLTITSPSDDFVDKLSEEMIKLIFHSFVAKEQNKFLDEVKSNLKIGEFLTICDFAENYTFVIQDCIQSYHWTNSQATIHPFVTYFRNADGKIDHISFVVISDILEHNTVAVHLFQRKFVQFIKEHVNENIDKIIYFSDGCAAQYKNRKNFVNLLYHKTDFDCDAEWHFFATSHGKGPCDGVGGSLKRAAALASLQRPIENQIVNATDLFEYAKGLPNINVTFCTKNEYEEEEIKLNTRFKKSVAIKGTQKLHSFVPISRTEIAAKTFSNSVETPKPIKIIKYL